MTSKTDPEGHTRPKVMSQLDEGIAIARRGDLAEARRVFRRIIQGRPDDEDAWLWLAWAAETKDESLRYLQEAQALLPDSARILEGIRWAKQQLGISDAIPPQATSMLNGKSRAKRGEPDSQADRLASGAKQAAQSIHRKADEALAHPREHRADTSVRPAFWGRLSALVMPAVSFLALVAVLAFVMLGISNARSRVQVVQALVLPTPVPEAAVTPSLKQRTEPLWVQVDTALLRSDWTGAIDALERIRDIDPRSDDARRKLSDAHYGRAVKLIELNRLEDARAEIDTAIRLEAGNAALLETRRQLQLYLTGLDAYWIQDWPSVVQNLKKVTELNSNFRDCKTMLAQAYYQVGIAKQEARTWDEARDAYREALKLVADLPGAKERLDKVMAEITPPRRIEVSISKAYTTLYEDNKPVKTFAVCTGRPTAPTVPGRYQVLDKMPTAYASKWDLNMPWWLGIYYAGGSENGFHALPILSNGQTLWAGYLGQKCSFGCIVLGTAEAKFLYDWAEIGTVVIVNP